MALTKKEILITKNILEEKLWLLNKDLTAYNEDLNEQKTDFAESYYKFMSIVNPKYDMEKHFATHKINMGLLEKKIISIEIILSKLEAENGIKSSR